MKGRKAIPNKIHEIRGGRAHTHRAPRKELNPPSKIPSCPSHLNKDAKKEWRRVVKILDSIGILTELDRTILAAHCEAYSRWIEAKGEVKDDGMVIETSSGPKISPYVKIAKEAYDQMIRTGSLLCLDPSSRASMSIANQKPSEAKDKTESFRKMKHGK